MLLISIQPFAFRKIFVLAAALFGLSSVACFADSLFMSLHFVSHKQALLAPVVVSINLPGRRQNP